MKFLAIHPDGFGDGGEWFPAFELEAEGPDAPPTSYRPLTRSMAVEDVQSYLDAFPGLTARGLAKVTGTWGMGAMAQSEDGMLVYSRAVPRSEHEEIHWVTMNLPEEEDEPEDFNALAAEDDLIETWENQMENWEDRPWVKLTNTEATEPATV